MAFYDSLRLEKGMYGVPGKSFTQVLEELDPSGNYEGGALGGLDAYQRQLKRFGIRVGGPASDPVEKFFQTSDSAALFPEYVSRAVRQGVEHADLLGEITATRTRIDSLDYRPIVSEPSEEEKSLMPAAEGASLPQTSVHTKDHLVHLHKRGRMLVSSYEALRFQKLDLFTVTLRQIGAYIARAQLKDAVDVLLDGDGNSNAAAVTSLSDVPGYGDLLDLWTGLAPYELNVILASTAAMKDLLSLAELRDAPAGLNFQGTGRAITPLGAKLLHAPQLSGNRFIGLDRSCALEMVQAGDVVTDYDRLIDRQLERAAISVTAGFAKIFTGAAKAVSYTPATQGGTA